LWSLRLVLLVVFGVAIYFCVPLSMNSYRVPHFRTVDGSMTRMDNDTGIEYTYEVNGVTYVGTRAQLFVSSRGRRTGGVRYWETPSQAYGWANTRTSVGESMTVYYLPTDPSTARLNIDVHPFGRWVMMLATPGLALVCLWSMFAVKKNPEIRFSVGWR